MRSSISAATSTPSSGASRPAGSSTRSGVASTRASPATGPPTARPRPDARAVLRPAGVHRARRGLRVRARGPGPVRRFLRDNSLSLAFCAILLAALVGQGLVGHTGFNHDAVAHQGAPISLWRYLTSSSFMADVMENWQSEYLQFTLYVAATVWFVQRGSTESKQPGEAGLESDEKQMIGKHAKPNSPRLAKVGGWRTRLYSNSFVLVM